MQKDRDLKSDQGTKESHQIAERQRGNRKNPKSHDGGRRGRRRNGNNKGEFASANIVSIDSPDDAEQYLDEGLPEKVSSVFMESPDDSVFEGRKHDKKRSRTSKTKK